MAKLDLGFKSKDYKWHITRAGDRTLTSAQKRKLKEETNYRCQKCGKSFKRLPKYLEVHHKKEVHKHKHPMGWDLPSYSQGHKIKPKSDRKNNLQVLCKDCHDKTKKKKKARKLNNPFRFGI